METLVTENINLVYSVLHRHYKSFANDEDLIQQGMIGLIYAAKKYDESKGIAFSTFATKCILNEFRKEFVRRLSQQKTASLDGDDEVSLYNILSTTRDMEDSDNKQSFEGFMKSLEEKNRRILEMKIDELPLTEIQKELGMTKSGVLKRMRSVKRLWKKWVNESEVD